VNSSPSPSDKVSTTELEKTLQNRLKETELEYFLDLCTGSNSVETPEDYFVGLVNKTRHPDTVTTQLVNHHPTAVRQFIELHDLYFQPGQLALSGIIDELVNQGFDRDLLNKEEFSQRRVRLLLLAFKEFYDINENAFSPGFDIMVGRAQIQHERTDARYAFDVSLPSSNHENITDRIDEFEQSEKHSGETIDIWRGPTDDGVWFKLFKQRNRLSEYVFEEDPNDGSMSVTTQSRYPVKTLSAELRAADDGVVIHVFDNLDQSGMKTTFRELLQYVADDSSAFESFEPIQSAEAEELVSTAVDEAKKAAEEDVQDADVLDTVQEQMDSLTDQTVSALEEKDDLNESEEHILEQLSNDPPIFVGIDILGDEQTGIEQFRVRSSAPFPTLGGQIEDFNEATLSLLREVAEEKVELVFRLADVHSDTQSLFSVGYGDWTDVRGVNRATYGTIEGLFGDIDE
jgi:hypothetical protein